MKIINKDVSIVRHIVNGNVEINSADEFKKTLQMFPDSAELHKAFGDLLVEKKIFVGAVNAYRKASEIFFEEGKVLQAISAKLHEWRLSRPKMKEYRALYVALRQCKIDPATNALGECFTKMNFKEFYSILPKIEILSLPPKFMVKKVGDEEDGLYFVVSGELNDSLSAPARLEKENTGEPVGHLAENYFFGDIYPFEQRKKSELFIQTTTKVELLKYAKTHLMTICGEHPDVEVGLKVLCQNHLQANQSRTLQVARNTSRQELSIKMRLEIFPQKSGRSPMVLKGYSSDISLGGVCIFLDPKYRDVPSAAMLGRNARVDISLSDETVSLSILGTLAWSKEFTINGVKTGALGIKFNPMPPNLRGLLLVFTSAIGIAAANEKEQ